MPPVNGPAGIVSTDVRSYPEVRETKAPQPRLLEGAECWGLSDRCQPLGRESG